MTEPTEDQLKDRALQLEKDLEQSALRERECSTLLCRYRDMFYGMRVAAFVADGHGMLVDANREACTLSGRGVERVRNEPAVSLVPEREQERFREEFRKALEGRPEAAGFTLRHVDGHEIPVEIRYELTETAGEVIVSMFIEDVSELSMRARRRYREGQIGVLGTLCEGVAHQFNTYLARMMACAEDASEAVYDPEVSQDLRTIVQTCEEASQVTERLLSYAGRRPLRRRSVNPVNILEHSLQMMEEDIIQAGVEVTRNYAPVSDMMLDNFLIGQMFRNVIRNALDAMPEGGRLDVGCAPDGPDVVIKIADSGIGIPAALLDRVFLPFVTTKGALSKSETPGMGLGLCVCQGVASSHYGTIGIESTRGKGTTVTIHLPFNQEDRPDDADEATTKSMSQ